MAGTAKFSLLVLFAAGVLGSTVCFADDAVTRDGVGDLNAQAVMAGEFPGSFKIPGPGTISLAIGGFIKSVAIYDSKAELMGSDFLPATLGLSKPDTNGGFSVDSTLTRFHVDGRAPVPTGKVKGYIEYDLNSLNNGTVDIRMRHAYGSWESDAGTLTVGHTWSTFMDLKILPEGLTEPTVSGVIFTRQSMIRWTQRLGSRVTYHVALEDPGNSDIAIPAGARAFTAAPDVIAGIEYGKSGVGHLRLNGIARRATVEIDPDQHYADTASGLTFTGGADVFAHDRVCFGGVYGEGLGRYFLGIESTAGSAFNETSREIDLRKQTGAMLWYKRQWSQKLRSTAMAGMAKSEALGWQSGTTFESSSYAAANLMWSIQPYLTLGIEYAYGQRVTKNSAERDNQRIALGVQIF